MAHDKSMNESIATSLLHDLKSMKLNESNDHNMMDKYKSIHNERAIVKSNDFNKHNQSTALNKISYSQWMPLQSPDPLNKSFNYKADSKEVLWASTQSSPNSTQRDQMKYSNQFKKSTSTPANLWESPNLKLSQQSALMIKNDSSSSVWYTPPQIQSPAISSGQSIWDSPTSSILNHSAESFSSDCAGLLRSQDLSPNDIWSNTGKLQTSSGFHSFKTDVWSNASPNGNKMETTIYTSTPFKSLASASQKDFSKKIAKPMTIANTTANTTVSQDINPASSSCLQLFSDDFMNYLNMIN